MRHLSRGFGTGPHSPAEGGVSLEEGTQPWVGEPKKGEEGVMGEPGEWRGEWGRWTACRRE